MWHASLPMLAAVAARIDAQQDATPALGAQPGSGLALVHALVRETHPGKKAWHEVLAAQAAEASQANLADRVAAGVA